MEIERKFSYQIVFYSFIGVHTVIHFPRPLVCHDVCMNAPNVPACSGKQLHTHISFVKNYSDSDSDINDNYFVHLDFSNKPTDVGSLILKNGTK